MYTRHTLIDTIKQREEERRKQEPAIRAEATARKKSKEALEAEALYKNKALLHWFSQFEGVALATGHQLHMKAVESCWELGVYAIGPKWIQVGVEHWGLKPGSIPGSVPLFLIRWDGHCYETVDGEKRRGYDGYQQAIDAAFEMMAALDGAAIQAAITRVRR